jgi:dimethylglycine dehydrogenase
MSATARRIGPIRPIRCPRISAFSSIPTRSTGWSPDRGFHGARAVLAEAGLAKTINGPIPYAPDGNPLMGPMPGVPNAFEACVFTFGIAQGGGAGKVLAEWITEGDRMGHVVLRPAPLHRLHRPRLLRRQGDGGLRPRIRHAFPMAPLARRPDRKLSPVHDRVKRWAARWAPMPAGNGPTGSRSRATTHRGSDPDLEPRRPVGAAHPRGMRGGARHAAFSTCRVSRGSPEGPGARRLALGKIAGGLPKPGRMNAGLFPRRRGRILTEMS